MLPVATLVAVCNDTQISSYLDDPSQARELYALQGLNKKLHSCLRQDTEAQGVTAKALMSDEPTVSKNVAQQTVASFKVRLSVIREGHRRAPPQDTTLPLHYHRTMGPVRWTALQQEVASFTVRTSNIDTCCNPSSFSASLLLPCHVSLLTPGSFLCLGLFDAWAP